MEQPLTGMQRFLLAFVAFFAVLFNRDFAEAVHRVRLQQKSGALPETKPADQLPETTARPAKAERVPTADALHLLAVLQREGRFVDFLMDPAVAGASDSDLGAAARVVHQGCKKVVDQYLSLEPVYKDPEGATISVPPGFDAARVRLIGNVVGNPPFKGALRHHGWQATEVRLPKSPDGLDPKVLAPAEVELS